MHHLHTAEVRLRKSSGPGELEIEGADEDDKYQWLLSDLAACGSKPKPSLSIIGNHGLRSPPKPTGRAHNGVAGHFLNP